MTLFIKLVTTKFHILFITHCGPAMQSWVLEVLSTEHEHGSPLCTYPHPHLGKVFQELVQQHWHIWKSDPNLKSVFEDLPHIVYKCAANIRDSHSLS